MHRMKCRWVMREHMDSIRRDIPVKFVLWINFGTVNARQIPFFTVLITYKLHCIRVVQYNPLAGVCQKSIWPNHSHHKRWDMHRTESPSTGFLSGTIPQPTSKNQSLKSCYTCCWAYSFKWWILIFLLRQFHRKTESTGVAVMDTCRNVKAKK